MKKFIHKILWCDFEYQEKVEYWSRSYLDKISKRRVCKKCWEINYRDFVMWWFHPIEYFNKYDQEFLNKLWKKDN